MTKLHNPYESARKFRPTAQKHRDVYTYFGYSVTIRRRITKGIPLWSATARIGGSMHQTVSESRSAAENRMKHAVYAVTDPKAVANAMDSTLTEPDQMPHSTRPHHEDRKREVRSHKGQMYSLQRRGSQWLAVARIGRDQHRISDPSKRTADAQMRALIGACPSCHR